MIAFAPSYSSFPSHGFCCYAVFCAFRYPLRSLRDEPCVPLPQSLLLLEVQGRYGLSDQVRRLQRLDVRRSQRASSNPRIFGCDPPSRQRLVPVPDSQRTWRFDWPCTPACQATWVTVSLLVSLMRCGWVKTSKPSLRATAASVIPAALAVRTASAVGAETATISGAPITAVFCTISTDTRLVSNTMPRWPGTLSRINAPASLSSALCLPTSSRTATRPASACQNAAA